MAESRFVYVTYIRTTRQKLWQALFDPEFTRKYWCETWQDCEWKVGASWRLTGQLNVETGLHWRGPTPDARLMRTDAGWVSGDPVTLTLSLAWRGE